MEEGQGSPARAVGVMMALLVRLGPAAQLVLPQIACVSYI